MITFCNLVKPVTALNVCLILSHQVEVTSSPGIFSPLEILDFGILRTLDEPRTLRLNLLNSGIKPIHISVSAQQNWKTTSMFSKA